MSKSEQVDKWIEEIAQQLESLNYAANTIGQGERCKPYGEKTAADLQSIQAYYRSYTLTGALENALPLCGVTAGTIRTSFIGCCTPRVPTIFRAVHIPDSQPGLLDLRHRCNRDSTMDGVLKILRWATKTIGQRIGIVGIVISGVCHWGSPAPAQN
jgi:hypothetical protein